MKSVCSVLRKDTNLQIAEYPVISKTEDTILLDLDGETNIVEKYHFQMQVNLLFDNEEEFVSGFVYLADPKLKWLCIGVKKYVDNRRKYVRVKVNKEDKVVLFTNEEKKDLDVNIINISAGGVAFLAKNSKISKGDIVEYCVKDNTEPMYLRGEVARVDEKKGNLYAVQFVHLHNHTVDRLNNYVLNLMRG